MKRYFTKTFFHYFFGFVGIIVLAFVALGFVSEKNNIQPQAIDNVAQPR